MCLCLCFCVCLCVCVCVCVCVSLALGVGVGVGVGVGGVCACVRACVFLCVRVRLRVACVLCRVLQRFLWAREPSGFLSCSQRFDGMWWLLVLGAAAQELGLGSPLVADDECAAASGGAGACAASALQRHARASASESESERVEMPPWWMMGLPPPWLQQPMQPMQPMPPMPPMQPMQPMYPWMRPMQPQYPTAQPAAQPATTAQPTAPRKAYLPLFPNGWGMIADEEGQELAQLTTSREHCEDACTATVGCNSFVFCTFGGCYLKTAQFVGQESTHYSGLCSTFWTPSQSSVSGSTTLPPLQQVETKQCSKGQVPEPLGGCGTSSEPTLMTFYQYRAQSGVVPKNRLWENINLANIGGVMFYLHNEVVDKDGEMRDTENQRTTKFQVDRVMRFKVTMKNSEALWKKFRAQFGQFIQFDYGQATFGMPDHVQKCNAIWSDFGYEARASDLRCNRDSRALPGGLPAQSHGHLGLRRGLLDLGQNEIATVLGSIQSILLIVV